MLYDELDLLEIRLNILDPVVDFFVITEATTTQIGKEKKMYFEESKERFSKFAAKIIYNPIDMNGIDFENQWHRETYQKNQCINGVANAQNEDIVIFSDLDEIPDPNAIKRILERFQSDKIYHFAQELFYFFFNYKNIDGTLLSSSGEFPDVQEKKWLGSKLCTVQMAKKYELDTLRHEYMLREHAVRVENGGWHFSYMGGTQSSVQERIKNKLGAFSHSEFDKWKYYNIFHIWLSIHTGKDLLGRKAKFAKVPITENYPEWLRNNYKNYQHFVL